MKKIDFDFKVEGLASSSMKSADSNGTLDAPDFIDASKQINEMAKMQFGDFKKITITMEEK